MPLLKLVFPALIAMLSWGCEQKPLAPPYPQSPLVESVGYFWDSHKRFAPGSDNWPVTWSDDDSQYTSWGDGGGFGGGNFRGRVSLGVARIDGGKDDYVGVNLWGGVGADQPDGVSGKSYGLLAVDGRLYMWVSPGSNNQAFIESRLYVSEDSGRTWRILDWAFRREDGIVNPTFAQFGKVYAGARDAYVYLYASQIKDDSRLEVQIPGDIMLMRVLRTHITDRSQYQFFTGLDDERQPKWSGDIRQARPVFEDKNGVGWNLSVSYNPGLQRYFLMTEHTASMQGNIGVFEAEEPWGPWFTVYYGKFADETEIQQSTFYYNFSNKWLSEDGLDFVMVFTGVGENDSWNTVTGRFVLREQKLR